MNDELTVRQLEIGRLNYRIAVLRAALPLLESPKVIERKRKELAALIAEQNRLQDLMIYE